MPNRKTLKKMCGYTLIGRLVVENPLIDVIGRALGVCRGVPSRLLGFLKDLLVGEWFGLGDDGFWSLFFQKGKEPHLSSFLNGFV